VSQAMRLSCGSVSDFPAQRTHCAVHRCRSGVTGCTIYPVCCGNRLFTTAGSGVLNCSVSRSMLDLLVCCPLVAPTACLVLPASTSKVCILCCCGCCCCRDELVRCCLYGGTADAPRQMRNSSRLSLSYNTFDVLMESP